MYSETTPLIGLRGDGTPARGNNVIDTLIFDFDGVIIDTETPDYLTWQEVFHSYGVELDRALWGRFIGLPC